MFDVGFWELLLLASVGLLVIGPDRLPAALAQLGRLLAHARSTLRLFQRELEQAAQLDEGADLRERMEQLERLREQAPEPPSKR